MLTGGEVAVWRIHLDALGGDSLPAPSSEEQTRAAQFRSALEGERYLRAHRAVRAILRLATDQPLDFAVADKGKPYLPAAPTVKFSLSHSHAMALVAVALEVEVGADIELLRPLPECGAIARRFFPPSEDAAFAATPRAGREREFFRRWTRIEAMLKAQGVGLHGAGAEVAGEWTVEEIMQPAYAAAVAAARADMRIVLRDL